MDESEFREALLAEYPTLLAAMRRMAGGNRAEDVAQEAILKALERQEQFKGGKLGAWLFTIAKHELFDQVKGANVKRRAYVAKEDERDGTQDLLDSGAPPWVISSEVDPVGATADRRDVVEVSRAGIRDQWGRNRRNAAIYLQRIRSLPTDHVTRQLLARRSPVTQLWVDMFTEFVVDGLGHKNLSQVKKVVSALSDSGSRLSDLDTSVLMLELEMLERGGATLRPLAHGKNLWAVRRPTQLDMEVYAFQRARRDPIRWRLDIEAIRNVSGFSLETGRRIYVWELGLFPSTPKAKADDRFTARAAEVYLSFLGQYVKRHFVKNNDDRKVIEETLSNLRRFPTKTEEMFLVNLLFDLPEELRRQVPKDVYTMRRLSAAGNARRASAPMTVAEYLEIVAREVIAADPGRHSKSVARKVLEGNDRRELDLPMNSLNLKERISALPPSERYKFQGVHRHMTNVYPLGLEPRFELLPISRAPIDPTGNGVFPAVQWTALTIDSKATTPVNWAEILDHTQGLGRHDRNLVQGVIVQIFGRGLRAHYESVLLARCDLPALAAELQPLERAALARELRRFRRQFPERQIPEFDNDLTPVVESAAPAKVNAAETPMPSLSNRLTPTKMTCETFIEIAGQQGVTPVIRADNRYVARKMLHDEPDAEVDGVDLESKLSALPKAKHGKFRTLHRQLTNAHPFSLEPRFGPLPISSAPIDPTGNGVFPAVQWTALTIDSKATTPVNWAEILDHTQGLGRHDRNLVQGVIVQIFGRGLRAHYESVLLARCDLPALAAELQPLERAALARELRRFRRQFPERQIPEFDNDLTPVVESAAPAKVNAAETPMPSLSNRLTPTKMTCETFIEIAGQQGVTPVIRADNRYVARKMLHDEPDAEVDGVDLESKLSALPKAKHGKFRTLHRQLTNAHPFSLEPRFGPSPISSAPIDPTGNGVFPAVQWTALTIDSKATTPVNWAEILDHTQGLGRHDRNLVQGVIVQIFGRGLRAHYESVLLARCDLPALAAELQPLERAALARELRRFRRQFPERQIPEFDNDLTPVVESAAPAKVNAAETPMPSLSNPSASTTFLDL